MVWEVWAASWAALESFGEPGTEHIYFPNQILLKRKYSEACIDYISNFLIKSYWKGCMRRHILVTSDFLVKSYWKWRLLSHGLNVSNFLIKSYWKGRIWNHALIISNLLIKSYWKACIRGGIYWISFISLSNPNENDELWAMRKINRK